jgi:hypothetical protein
MTTKDLVRVAVGMALGLGLASLPFLHYAARTHHHAPSPAHVHSHDE